LIDIVLSCIYLQTNQKQTREKTKPDKPVLYVAPVNLDKRRQVIAKQKQIYIHYKLDKKLTTG
jgi:hypothetical protein